MKSLRHVLVPLDFEAASREALVRAVVLARTFDASVTLLHVAGVTPCEDAARSLFIKAAAELCAEYPRAHAVMRRGIPSVEILSAMQDTKADLVVLGRGRPPHALLGSVIEQIVRLAPVPVLTLRSDASRGRRHDEARFRSGIRRILVSSDLGTTDSALRWATAFAVPLGASVIVTDRASTSSFHNSRPSASQHVVGLAVSAEADLIVMGTRRRLDPSSTPFESLAEAVVQSSPVPVLTMYDAA